MYGTHDAWSQLDDHMCVTWISGATPDDVIRTLGADGTEFIHPRAMTVQEEAEGVFAEDRGDGHLLIRRHESWIIVLEIRSRRGADDTALTTLSQQGQALNITTDGPGAQVTYAVGGQIVQTFDADDLGEKDLADEPDIRQALRWAQSFDIEAQEWAEYAKSTALSLAEAVTGMEIDDSWVTEGWAAVQLLPKPRPAAHAPVPVPYADMRQLAERNIQVRTFLENPGVEQITAMKHLLARIAVTTADLSHPLVEEAMSALENQARPQRVERLRDELKALAQEFFQQAGEGPWPAGATPYTEPAMDTLVRQGDATLAVEAALDDTDWSSSYQRCSRKTRIVRLGKQEYLIMETLDIVYKHICKMTV
ncbi:DUF6461 domain-containing protein [Streptosporangium sp. NPDC049644]|uniref:DUF6461 domain-containing protein n=1 Tax=Streptosporangium sp. NPDC049644 TaxID=3155507 RepID=UPI003438C02C